MSAKVIWLDDYRRTPSPLQKQREEDGRLRNYYRMAAEYLDKRRREVWWDEDGVYWTREDGHE